MIDQKNKSVLEEALTFWPHLTKEEQELLLYHTELLRYQSGANLYSADNECLGVLVVKSGEIRAYILSEEGKEITLYRLNRGDVCVMSASCVLHSITFDVHIDAEKDTEVLMISAGTFAQLSSQNLHVENFALRIGMEKFSEVMWAMEQILFMSFDRRLAVFLIDETARTGTDEVALTHEQIARYMGSAREVVSRMLKHFASEGLVELHRGGVRILNRTAMKKLT